MVRALVFMFMCSSWQATCEWGDDSKRRLALREVAAFSTATTLGKAGRAVIRDANAWTQYWQSRFTPNGAVPGAPAVPTQPSVDFGREMLLVASEIIGSCENIRINSVRRRDEVIVVTTVIEPPPSGSVCAAVLFNSTYIAAIERSSLPVRFEPLDGTWSGPGALAQVDVQRATFTFACGRGRTDGPLRLDDAGRFSAGGGFELEPGLLTPARYSGTSDGQTMSLEVELTGAGVVLPQSRFFLTRGETGAPAQSCGSGN